MKKQAIRTLLRTLPLSALLFALASCGGGGSDDPAPVPVPDPEAAILEFPANNEVCFDGTVISDSMSEVSFSWQPALHSDSYELRITNLETNAIKTFPTQNAEIDVTLERGTPYSWSVKSKARNTTAQADSETWKFYLAGGGIANYAPFPAALLEPSSGTTIDPAKAVFEWKGSDADSEDLTYELFVDTIDGKTNKLTGPVSDRSFETTLEAGTIYFWSVVTIDPEGNRSRSAVYSFKTQ